MEVGRVGCLILRQAQDRLRATYPGETNDASCENSHTLSLRGAGETEAISNPPESPFTKGGLRGIASPEPALSGSEILRLRLRMTKSEGGHNGKRLPVVGFKSVRSHTLDTDWGPMDLDIGRKA